MNKYYIPPPPRAYWRHSGQKEQQHVVGEQALEGKTGRGKGVAQSKVNMETNTWIQAKLYNGRQTWWFFGGDFGGMGGLFLHWNVNICAIVCRINN